MCAHACAASRYEVYLVALHHIQIGTFAGYDGMYWISISGAPPPPFVVTLQITHQSSLARTSYRMLLVFFPAAACRRSMHFDTHGSATSGPPSLRASLYALSGLHQRIVGLRGGAAQSMPSVFALVHSTWCFFCRYVVCRMLWWLRRVRARVRHCCTDDEEVADHRHHIDLRRVRLHFGVRPALPHSVRPTAPFPRSLPPHRPRLSCEY